MTDKLNERALVTLLADAKSHSVLDLKQKLSLTSAELRDVIATLTDKGLAIACDDQSCRLKKPIDLLEEARIRAALAPDLNVGISDIEVLWHTASTNTRMLEKRVPEAGQLRVCLAEFQSSGRGRLQRTWHAPLGGGICMSVSWALEELAEDLATAGLVAGVAVRDALEKCGVGKPQLKWPNDLLVGRRKIGGLLLEVRRETGSASRTAAKLVIGIGLNYLLDAAARADIESLGGLEPGDILGVSGDDTPDRNQLAAAVLSELLPALRRFSREGFAPFASAWREADACRDLPVLVTTSSEQLSGVARGINAHGALQLDMNGKIKSIVSAQVSLRPA